uniref:Uncharacterized protein n=1 Tax=Ditylenchus dipsaci TaxID=166011 RepID=A0A915DT75_9BILA
MENSSLIKLQELCGVLRNRAISQANQEQVRLAVIGLCRDLMVSYIYGLIYCVPLASLKCLSFCKELPHCGQNVADVTTLILKLIVELTINRQSRLTYDMHSCVSVILFREVSKIICNYGGRLLALLRFPKTSPIKKKSKYRPYLWNTSSLT